MNKLIEMLECQGNKILKNVKVWWILMFSPSKRVLVEYKTLVVKWFKIETTKINYELLCDVETLLGISCTLFLLETMQGLSKFA